MDLKERGLGNIDGIDLAQLTLDKDRRRILVNMVTNLWIP
jgi:hypothetical protein